MTRRSQKASEDDVGDDQKTVDQTIVKSIEIRSPKVEQSSGDARAMVVTGSMPLLGLELPAIENKRQSSDQYEDSNHQTIASPLLGTILDLQNRSRHNARWRATGS